MIEEHRYKKLNWPLFIAAIVIMLIILFYFDQAIAEERDPEAVRVANQTFQAMGGLDAWMQVKAIRFNFQVEPEGAPPRAVKHLWDRAHGRDHVEGKNREGKMMVAWVDLRNKTGHAWIDGAKAEGEDLSKALEWAYARWVNDTYWMIMPFKLLDGGVNLKHEGVKDGSEVLHLSFGKVGLTPGDQYWAFINKETGLMNQWEYLLQGETEKDGWDWLEWTQLGSVKLSKLKQSKDGKTAIRLEPLEVTAEADPSYFSKELKLLP